MENIEIKVINLVEGIQQLEHKEELTAESFLQLGSVLGVTRAQDSGVVTFDNDAYIAEVRNTLITPEGRKKLEVYYGSLDAEGRQQIGQAINRVRIRE